MWTPSGIEPVPESEVKFINKRDHDPSDSTDADAERLARRRAIKQRNAKLFLKYKRRQELQQSRQQIDARLDKLASDFEEEMQPVQASIQVLERRIISCVSGGRPVDPQDEQQRAELLRKVEDANRKLQTDIAAEKQLIPIIEKELAELMRDAAEYQASAFDLGRRNVACPVLWRKYEVLKNRSKWCDHRIASLTESLGDLENKLNQLRRYQVEQPSIAGHYTKDIDWTQLLIGDAEAMLDDARLQAAEARTAAEELRREIVAE